MASKNLLDNKKILIVDDEPDVLEALVELLSMCEVVKASTFEDAKELLETQDFDKKFGPDWQKEHGFKVR